MEEVRNGKKLILVLLLSCILASACNTQEQGADGGTPDAGVQSDAGGGGKDATFQDASSDAADTGYADGSWTDQDAGHIDAGTDSGGGCPPDCPKGEMISIPATSFWMGCNEAVDIECGDEEKPYHQVSLSAYQIGKYEVSVYEYAQCVAAMGCSEPATGTGCNWGVEGKERDPVNCIDLISARMFCKWAGKRLTTEAEWENAARGDDGRKFPWGNSPGVDCTRAVCVDNMGGPKGCGANGTMQIGSKPLGASPYALMDMIGNVREWVNDYYQKDYYSISPAQDPKGPDKPGINGIQRGGSWDNFGSYNARTSNRLPKDIGNADPYVGFRCAK